MDGGANEPGLLTFSALTTFALQSNLPDTSRWYNLTGGATASAMVVGAASLTPAVIVAAGAAAKIAAGGQRAVALGGAG